MSQNVALCLCIEVKNCYGVSAGAVCGMNYVAKQKERTYRTVVDCHYNGESDTYTCAPADTNAEYTCPHDDGCGYADAVEGASCTHSCEICQPEKSCEQETVVDEKASVTANTEGVGAILAKNSNADVRTTTLRLNNYGEGSGGVWSAPVDNVSSYTVVGSTDEGWAWTYDITNEKYTLKLVNAKIEVVNGSAIQFPVPKTDIKIDIVLSGDNTVSGGGNDAYDQALSGIYVPVNTMNPFSSDVTIKGDGSLNVSRHPNKPITHNYGKAICIEKGSLAINDVDVTAIGPIQVFTDISITNSNVTVESFNSNSPLDCYSNMTIENSTIASTVSNQLVGATDDSSRAVQAGKAMTIKTVANPFL